jgi:tungstate transport system substrate-binding protein
MRARPITAALLLAVGMTGAACGGGNERIIVAAGTTVVDSGVVDRLATVYEASLAGIDVSVVGRSTREVLDLGSRGAADILITHAPDQEAAFLLQHLEAEAYSLFSSRFVLAGPAERSRRLDGMAPQAAFAEIARQGWAFATRADGSGTYEIEEGLWASADVDPDGMGWYVETGQGMGLSLQVADQRDAFILAEEGTFLAARKTVRLRPVEFATGTHPVNAYVAIVPSPGGVVDDFVTWLLSSAGRVVLMEVNEELFGLEVFAAG